MLDILFLTFFLTLFALLRSDEKISPFAIQAVPVFFSAEQERASHEHSRVSEHEQGYSNIDTLAEKETELEDAISYSPLLSCSDLEKKISSIYTSRDDFLRFCLLPYSQEGFPLMKAIGITVISKL